MPVCLYMCVSKKMCNFKNISIRTYTELILVIHWFHIFRFTYLLRFVCNLTTDTFGAFVVITDVPVHNVWVAWWVKTCRVQMQLGYVLPSCLSFHTTHQCVFFSVVITSLLCFWWFCCWWFCCLKCSPRVVLKCDLFC